MHTVHMGCRLPVGSVFWFAIVLAAATLPLIGCVSVRKTDVTPTGTVELSPTVGTRAGSGEPEPLAGSPPYLLFNQRWIEGMSSDAVDLEDVDAVFWQVFSGLPEEVTVYP